MKTKNLFLTAALLFSLSAVFVSCSKEKDNDDDTIITPVPTPDASFPSITVSGNITSNTTWTKDKIVYLDGRVIVEAAAELTIEAGTIVKGKAGSDANASVLVVGVGAKIHATGTASEPIIFTSEDDAIVPGNIASPNLTITNKGLWGGVIILGDAPISPSSGTTAEVEGIPPSAATTYGGNDVSDNSGEFQYCSIRHGGIIIGAGNEINGLTLGGVGNGTTIDHVEIYGNLDDGIEFFGGSVNVTDAIVVKIDDDSYDVDQAYSGTVSNFIAIVSPTADGDAFEIDGPEGSSNATGKFTFDKGYVVGSGKNQSLYPSNANFAVFKSSAQGTMQNVYFTDFKPGANVKFKGSSANSNYSNGVDLVVTGCTFNESSLSGIFNSDGGASDASFVNNNTTATGITNGIDFSQFTGWTLAGYSGQIAKTMGN